MCLGISTEASPTSSRNSFTTIVSASENWISRSGIDGAGEQGLFSLSSQMKHLFRMTSTGKVRPMVYDVADGFVLVAAVVGGAGKGEGIMAEAIHLIYYQYVS